MIYLDNSATTQVLPSAAEAAARCMRETFFNPSAAYGPAARLERSVNTVREHIAQTLACPAGEIIFTSGGTESNNTALFGTLRAQAARFKGGRMRLITSRSEHPSVYEVFKLLELHYGMDVVYLPQNADGSVSLGALRDALTPETALVSLMHVNNETGAVSDIEGAGALIRSLAPEAVFHVDGVQAYGKLPFGPLPCDLYSVSGHKLHAPKGIGFLRAKAGTRFSGGLIGGGQEQDRRSGTTNAPAILALDEAVRFFRDDQPAIIETMRQNKLRLAEALLTVEDAFINGPKPGEGAPHILNVSFPGVRGEVLLHALEQKEIYVSTGSACSTHKKGGNRILTAINVTGARQEGAVRISLCPFNTAEEMDTAAEEIKKQVTFLRRFQRR